MKNMMSFKGKGSMSVLLAATVLLFSQCQKDEQTYTPETEIISAKDIAETSAATSIVPKTLDVSKATLDKGNAYVIYGIDLGVTGDASGKLTSPVRIFENGKELGPAHASHSDIRSTGKGRFSHWGKDLYFSTSDNSNPKTNGRKYTFATQAGEVSTGTGTSTSTTPTAPTPTAPTTSSSDPLALSNLIGYANVNGKTTGGQGGQTVTVTTLSALKSALESSSPMIIKVSGTIKGTGSLYVKSNKTLQGLKGAILDGVGLYVFNVSNIIIQNLTIRNVIAGTGDNDCVNIKYSHHIWIDHCDFYAKVVSNWDTYDGLIDITRESDYITVSWNKLHDTNKAVLIGAGDANTSDKGKLRVTLYKNYMYNLSERQPRVRFGNVHAFNNYHKNSSGYAVVSSMGGTVRTDNNYYEGISAPIRTDIGATAGYISGASTNKYVSCGSNKITTSASTWTPASIYSYSSALIPAENVPSVVLAGAGPR